MTTQEDTPRRPRAVVVVVGLFALVFLVYLPSVRNGFIYDDHKIIVRHPGASTPAEIAQVFRERHFPRFPYYRPITRTTLLVQKAIHGPEPAAFHVFNAALMGLAALAAFALLRCAVFAIPGPAAWWTALVFAVHPVASTCVYPICSGRETLMPATVVVATVAAYLRAGRTWFWLAQAGVLAALFCKEQAVVLPVLLVLADLLGLSRRGPPRRLVAWLGRYGPMLLILLGYALVRHRIFGSTEYQVRALEHPLGPLQSFLYAFQVLLAPYLQVVYEPVFAVWASWPRALLTVLLLGTLGWMVRRTRTPPVRVLLFWAAWFVLPYLPTANLLRQEAPFAERYVFLSSLGLLAVAAATLSSWTPERLWRPVLVAAAVLAVLLAAISMARGPIYRSDTRFASQWVATNPDAYEAHFSLGTVALDEDRPQDARGHFEAAVRVQPEFADAHLHLAQIAHREGDDPRALRHLEVALKLHSGDAMTRMIAGQILSAMGRHEDAIAHLTESIRLDPDFASAHNLLGVTYCRMGRIEDGIPHLETADRLGSVEAQKNLEMARRSSGRE